MIKSDDQLVMVEAKLNVRAEANIKEQLTKYAESSHLKLNRDSRMIINDSSEKMLLIDTEALYTFSHKSLCLTPIFKLDDLSDSTLPQLKLIIAQEFSMQIRIQRANITARRLL